MRARATLVASMTLAAMLAAMLAAAAPVWAFSGLATSAGCGLDGCHTHAGYADFSSWHTSHESPNLPLPCESCHPNNHTISGPASAPEATYDVAVACNPCHVGMDTAPVHATAGVTSCVSCHPVSGTLTGYVTGATGALEGATITIGNATTVVTYAGGQYVAARVPVGTYDVTFSMNGYESRTVTGVIVAAKVTTVQDVTLSPLALPDAVAPVTLSDARASYDMTATIRLSATDEVGGSGVAGTWWRLDGSTQWNQGSTVTTAAPGSHVLEYYSIDTAGNTESAHRAVLIVRSRPVVGTPSAPSTMSRLRSGAVYATLKPRHSAGSYPVRICRWKRTSSGSWKRYSDLSAKASNYYSYTRCVRSVRLPYAGRWRLRAYAPADTLHIAAWSAGYRYVSVK